VKAMIEEMEAPPRAVIFDSSAWYQIDVTSVDIMEKLAKELNGKGIQVYLADVHAPVLDYSRKTGLLESIGEDHVFLTVDAAVRAIEAQQHDD